MAYPPSTPPGDRAPTTPLSGNHDVEHNQVANALDDIITELGASPKGPDASIEARLDRLEAELQPVGSIVMHTDTAAPPGPYVECNNQALARTGTYAALFAKIGTRFGAGDGTTTFNVPDFRGRSPVGPAGDLGGTVGQSLGRNDVVVPLHSHTIPNHDHPATGLSGSVSIDHDHGNLALTSPKGVIGEPSGWSLSATGILFGSASSVNAALGSSLVSGSPANWANQTINVNLPNLDLANRTVTISGTTGDKTGLSTDPAGEATTDDNYHPVEVVSFWIRY